MIGDIERTIFDLQARCSRFEALLSDYQSKMENLCKAALHYEKILNVKSENEKISQQNLEEEKKKLQEFITDASNSFKFFENEITQIKSSFKGVDHLIIKLQKEIVNCYENSSFYLESSNNNLCLLRQELYKAIDQKIEKIPVPYIPEMDDIKKEIDFKLEPISLDAKNGVLRSSHCEMKIMIMEKKIDQIFLLLKKHEINQ